jgi:hypothetical protein
MNEDQALELFAPARERDMPPARFSLAEVYEADARIRRRHRRAAVVATVAAVVVAIVAASAFSGTPSRRSLQPTATASPTGADLLSLLDRIVLPADAVQVESNPLQADSLQQSPYASLAGYVERSRYWTSTLSPKAALAAVTARPPAGTSISTTESGTYQGRPELGVTYDKPETSGLDGPHLSLRAETMPSGGTAITADAWEIVKPAKVVADLVRGTVTSVTVGYWAFRGANTRPFLQREVSGRQADQLAADINALWVRGVPPHECGPSPVTISLTFQTSVATQSFSSVCGTVAPDGVEGPALKTSTALSKHLDADFGSLMPTPKPSTSSEGLPATSAAAAPSLVRLLDRIPVPGNARQVSSPADGEPADAAGYSGQPGYEQAARYWTTSLTPAAAIAAMTARSPAGMTGGVMPPMPNKGRPDAQADYKAADSSSLVGPRLHLYAIALPDGGTAISALAWDIQNSAKPAADLVAGTVVSVTGRYSYGNGGPQTGTLTGAPARQLGADFNALLVNTAPAGQGCARPAASLTLTFHTTHGDKAVKATCGGVTVLPSSRAAPDLETSNAFNLDVNQAFVALMPTPLPSSAPLPQG